MELRDYLNVIVGRRWLIIQATFVVAMTALTVSLVLPKTYSGEAKVLISEKDTGAAIFGTVLPEFSSQPERGIQTQVRLMQIRPLAETTVRELGLESTPAELMSRLQVSATADANLVIVRAQADDPEMAAAIANAIAEAYVEWSRDVKRESLRSAANEVETRLNQVEAEILEIGERLEARGSSDRFAVELRLLTDSYATLAEKLEQLRINEELEVGSGRVVEVAIANPSPVAPDIRRNTIIGLAMGLAFGIGMAFLYEYLDNTIKTSETAARVFGAPVIGTIPLAKGEKGLRSLAIVDKPGSATAESYRVLRNSLDFINFERDLKTLIVTSAAPGEGKSTVAANLAMSLSQTGKKVVLVASDFRRSTVEDFFSVNNLIGLSDVLLGTHSLKAALQRPGSESLLVLAPGKLPPNPSELLGSGRMEAVLRELKEWADWIIIDTPPLLAVADPATLARWADGVLMVMQAGRSTKDAGKRAVELLVNVGARIIGAVVWGLPESGSTGYGYFVDQYYYSEYYSTAARAAKKRHKTGDHGSGEALDTVYMPVVSPGRRFLSFIGKLFSGLLAFLIVLVIALATLYFLDQYFAWGLANLIPY